MDSEPKTTWSAAEDKTLIAIVAATKTRKWPVIMKQFTEAFPDTTKTKKQCRQRWETHLNPVQFPGSLSSEKKQLLCQLHQKYGNNWKLIADEVPWRSYARIKDFFYSKLKTIKKKNKGPKRDTRTWKNILADTNMTVLFEEANPIIPDLDSVAKTAKIEQWPQSILTVVEPVRGYLPCSNRWKTHIQRACWLVICFFLENLELFTVNILQNSPS